MMRKSDLEKEITELKRLYERGVFSKKSYESAVNALQNGSSKTENSGDGAVVKGNGSVGAASNSIAVGGSITTEAEQKIINGSNNLVADFMAVYLRPDDQGYEEEKRKLRKQLAFYLKWMLAEHGTIELRGIKRDGKQVVSLPLKTVYVPLAAVNSNQQDPFELDRILMQGQHIVITGGPGSGKTTVLQHIAYTLCQAIATEQPFIAMEKLGLYVQEKPDANEPIISLPLPIYVPLSLYDRYCKHLPIDAEPEDKTLAAFIGKYLIERQVFFNLPKEFFQSLLRHDHAVILLLDGLDEVPGEKERSRVRAAIEDLVKARDEIRVIVTCRSAAYKGRSAIGREFSQIQVLPLGHSHVELMVHYGYAAIHANNPQQGEIDAINLLQSIGKLEEQRRQRSGNEFQVLVDSPLMVRLLLIVHYSERRLPEQRAELYEVAIMNMLYPDYGMDNQVVEHISKLIGGSEKQHRDLAQFIAFRMHSVGEKQGREISESQLRNILSDNPVYFELADDFIELTRLRGTLMEERLGMYRFIHLAFQEFLTARYLAEVLRTEDKIVIFFQNNRITQSWWKEVILLTIGYMTINSSTTAVSLIRLLAGLDQIHDSKQSILSSNIQIASAGLAWISVQEWPETPTNLKKTVPDRFLEIFHNDSLFKNSQNRVEVGNFLGRLGDPRFRTNFWHLPDEDMLGFIEIPAGNFLMGNDAYEHATPQHSVNLGRFFISRLPVTVAQFKAFVDDSGFSPSHKNSISGIGNHPVKWISFDDAMAYCNWLHETLQQSLELPYLMRTLFMDEFYHIRLPSEAEWEKAARGRSGKYYPWGNEKANHKCANYQDAKIKTTSPVGCFPAGTSPYGLLDCVGNVWEWTRSLWGKNWKKPDFVYPYDPSDVRREDENIDKMIKRVLRGGFFKSAGASITCAMRDWPDPGSGGEFRGFRVIIGPKIEQSEAELLIQDDMAKKNA